MQVITLISDYGSGSHYVAALKGKILGVMPNVKLVDISHDLKPFDILQTAFVLRNTFENFPVGTIHLISVDTNINLHKQFLIAAYKSHFFICADNGIFSLLFDEKPEWIRTIKDELVDKTDLFADKNLWVDVVQKLSTQTNPDTFSHPSADTTNLQLLKPVVDENIIRASIVFIDGYQNAFINLNKRLFDDVGLGRKFRLYYFGKSFISKISTHYHQVAEGDELALFNESGYLEIAMNKGKAAQLLGLKVGNKVVIEFYD